MNRYVICSWHIQGPYEGGLASTPIAFALQAGCDFVNDNELASSQG